MEGKQTRLDVGNDLFDGASSVRRILAPAVGAYVKIEEIRNAVIEKAGGSLVLLALGPTATVLVSQLAECGIQALDIGHVDIEYGWFLQGVAERVAIKGKYTNEVAEGRNVDDCLDEKYISQVICRLK